LIPVILVAEEWELC